MLQDVVHAWRTLRRTPSYAILVATTLALGIGANSAIFNVAWQVLLKPLPFADEDRLVFLWEAYGRARDTNTVAPATFVDWQREANSFEAIAAFNINRSALHLTGAGEPRELEIAHVTEQYFTVLGISATLGRTIQP